MKWAVSGIAQSFRGIYEISFIFGLPEIFAQHPAVHHKSKRWATKRPREIIEAMTMTQNGSNPITSSRNYFYSPEIDQNIYISLWIFNERSVSQWTMTLKQNLKPVSILRLNHRHSVSSVSERASFRLLLSLDVGCLLRCFGPTRDKSARFDQAAFFTAEWK